MRPLWIALRIVAFALAGAVLTAGVAWGVAVTADAHSGSSAGLVSIHRPDELAEKYPGAKVLYLATYTRGLGYGTLVADPSATAHHASGEDRRDEVHEVFPRWCRQRLLSHWNGYQRETLVARASGWPWLAAQSECDISRRQSDGIVMIRGPGWLRDLNDFVSLPLRPLWPGFALDTAFYGTLVFLLSSAPAFLRRRSRLRRGACPACGYDLRGFGESTCPECGA
jgi:hypothetical protein